jgi:hypothetical protein
MQKASNIESFSIRPFINLLFTWDRPRKMCRMLSNLRRDS